MTYCKLNKDIKDIRTKLEEISNEMSLSDNEQDFANLCLEQDFLENELLINEEYLEKVISRGRR